MPLLVSLRSFLSQRRSPLLKRIMEFLVFLYREYKKDVQGTHWVLPLSLPRSSDTHWLYLRLYH